MSLTYKSIVILLLLSVASLSAQNLTTPQTKNTNEENELFNPGVIVEEVIPDYGAETAGIQKGDVLLSWSRGTSSGTIESPFEIIKLDTEQRPLGVVLIEGRRNHEKREWKMGGMFWGISGIPSFKEPVLLWSQENVRAFELRLARMPDSAFRYPWLRPWLWMHLGASLTSEKRLLEAHDAFRQATLLLTGCTPEFRSYSWRKFAESTTAVHDYQTARLATSRWIEAARQSESKFWLAFALRNMGGLDAMQEDLAGARMHLEQALNILDQLSPDSFEAAWALTSLAAVLTIRGDFGPAETYLYRAYHIEFKSVTSPLLESAILDVFGTLAWHRGDYSRSEQFYRRSIAVLRTVAPESPNLVEALCDLGILLRDSGQLKESITALQESVDLARKIEPHTLPLARYLGNLGSVLSTNGDLTAADKYLTEAHGLIQDLGISGFWLADTLYDLAALRFKQGKLDEAEAYQRQTISIAAQTSSSNTLYKDALIFLARLKRQAGDIDAAADFYRRGLDTIELQTSLIGGSNDIRAGFRARYASYYREYIDLLLQQKKIDQAFQAIERSRARTLLETLAAAQVNIRKGVDPALLDRQRNLQADVHAKSERRIRLLGDKESKERDEQVKQVEKEVAGLLAELQDVESQLRSSSPGYAALTQPQPLTAKQIQQQLLDPDTLLLEYSLGEERSYVFALSQTSLQAFELPKRAEIERSARRVYGLLTIRNHPVKGESEDQTRKRQAQAETEYPAAAAELSRMVLGSVAGHLGNKRLLIVADGALQYIPFAMLPEPARNTSTTAARRQQVPLVVNHEIVNLPSASVLAVLRQEAKGRKPAPKAVAVLADPVFDQHDSRLTVAMKPRAPTVHLAGTSATRGSDYPNESQPPELYDTALVEPDATAPVQSGGVTKDKNTAAPDPLADLLGDDLLNEADSTSAHLLTRSADDLGLSRDGKLSLPRLLFSRQEADAIRAVTPAGQVKEAVDFQASREAALSPDLRNYRIVHFATHGLLNSEHPELSGLVFSLVDEHGQPQDGFLQLQDIYNLDLPADLVVLSACETGLGKEINGEGLIGLTRGFMYAGATRVVASLWNVSDAATASLMAEFYRAMEKDHMPPAAALRAAQIHMWQQKRWASPYYWAAFQIQGEWK